MRSNFFLYGLNNSHRPSRGNCHIDCLTSHYWLYWLGYLSLASTFVTESLVVVLTWMKTARTRRALSRMNIQTPFLSLLSHDGKSLHSLFIRAWSRCDDPSRNIILCVSNCGIAVSRWFIYRIKKRLGAAVGIMSTISKASSDLKFDLMYRNTWRQFRLPPLTSSSCRKYEPVTKNTRDWSSLIASSLFVSRAFCLGSARYILPMARLHRYL